MTNRPPRYHGYRFPSEIIKALGGIHLTGVTRIHCSPWVVRWRALQARRVPSGVRRRGRHGSRARAGEEVLVAHRGVGHGEVEHPIEHHPAAAGTAAVEAEHELIQVPGQVRVAHRALVGAQQPPLDQRGDSVHRGEESSPGSSPRARAARWLRRSWT